MPFWGVLFSPMLGEQFRWREAVSSLLPCMQSISDEEKGCLVLSHACRAIQMMSLVRPNLDRHPRPCKKKRKRFLLKENPESRSVRHRRCKNGWERERARERGPISSPQKLRNQIDPIPKQRSKGKEKNTKDKKTKNNALCLSSFAIWELDERNSLDDAGRIWHRCCSSSSNNNNGNNSRVRQAWYSDRTVR